MIRMVSIETGFWSLGLIIATVLILRFCRIENLTVFDWLSVKFYPDTKNSFALSTKDKIGFVLSPDGRVAKIHLAVTYKGSENTSFNNARLFIAGIGWFVFKQFFRESKAMRQPVKLPLVLKQGKI